ncbi:hypothetical protein GCM10007989_16980 [Devosia pacifica]|uniref:Uncharacterized protein n=1 Tax=Devosia pacifica TaxID=1335967 RepID=A0A918VTM4_9HYPH|nr:hypothetical protein [Devosia pacifica]GHA22200.1 hypothetical protein GCM10007989_16980 [Devosia pacifica]
MKYQPLYPAYGELPDAPLAMPKQVLERPQQPRIGLLQRALFALSWR